MARSREEDPFDVLETYALDFDSEPYYFDDECPCCSDWRDDVEVDKLCSEDEPEGISRFANRPRAGEK